MSRLRESLKKHEELRLTVYDDATGKALRPGDVVIGHPTIGYGRCLDTNGISAAEAHYLLDSSITVATKQAQLFPWFWDLNVARQDVVLEMIFNLGLQGIREFKRMLAALERRQYSIAAAEMLHSNWSKQVGERAQTLSEMMATGEYPKDS